MFVNDDDCGLHQDYDDRLDGPAPHGPVSKYRHNRTGEEYADAHLKRQAMGREAAAAITDGRSDIGPWEQVATGSLMGVAGNGC